ncbi:MAG: 23S rRNA (adenine(2503)-C(2))-methyltransferase RlmN [Cardiobacteriaceae bacterium]|nr:23S rRNA (adenine(2503)-C(2))-methyltransferase RlmN [Cardiobacteriaceae bacterium]
MSVNLFDLNLSQLEKFFTEIGEKPFRARQLMKWIYHAGILDFDLMTDFGKALREKLRAKAHFVLPEIVSDKTSLDGTRKWLFRYGCGNSIETVFIPEDGRGTLCISSQAGCALDCPFCSTGKQGFNRNLSAGEIAVQVWYAKKLLGEFDGKVQDSRRRSVSNVVLMGMGEPLLNFSSVVTAVDIFLCDYGFGLSKRRVTISTSGIVPAIEKLREVSEVSLAISLHAPNDELRNQLVPINARYGLQDLLAACQKYIDNNRQHGGIVWEYVLLAGVNDRPEQAEELARLLKNIGGKINLIPFNPYPESPYQKPSKNSVLRFQRILAENGFTTTIRKTRGDEIDAACGQLVGNVKNKMRKRGEIANSNKVAVSG